MPLPFGPLVGFPQQSTVGVPPGYHDQGPQPAAGFYPQLPPGGLEALAASGAVPTNEAGGPDFSGMESLVEALMGQMGAPPEGAPMQDPGGPANPLASMAAVFAASMADSLTGRRGQTANVQRQLVMHEQNRRRIEKENRDTEAENLRQVQEFQIGKLEQINKIKYRMAEEMMDYEKMEKVLKDDMRLAKLKSTLAGEREMNLAEERTKRITGDESKEGMSPASESVALTRVRKALIGSVFGLDNTYKKMNTGPGGDEVTRGPMNDEFFEEGRREAASHIRQEPSMAGKSLAAEYYLRTLHEHRAGPNGMFYTDANGKFSKEVIAFLNLLNQNLGDELGSAFLIEHGLLGPQGQTAKRGK